MKTVSFELNDEIADWLMAMNAQKRALMLKFMVNIEKGSDWKKVFTKTSDQAEKQGLTTEELDNILKKELTDDDINNLLKN